MTNEEFEKDCVRIAVIISLLLITVFGLIVFNPKAEAKPVDSMESKA